MMNFTELAQAVDLFRSYMTEPLTGSRRPIRMRLSGKYGVLQQVLLVQRVDIVESICEGITGHLTCLSTSVDLPLSTFIGLPVEIQLVNDRGSLRYIRMIVTEARAGQSDGSLATFQLTGRDAFALLERRVTTRIFINKSVLDIVRIILDEHRERLPALARAFDYKFLNIDESQYPPRACTFQLNENDAAFLTRLFKQVGLSWFFRPTPEETTIGSEESTPQHQLIVFDDGMQLSENNAGTVRYQRLDGTAQRDGINLWAPARQLSSGGATRSTWDYKAPAIHRAELLSVFDQGEGGNDLAKGLIDSRIEMPHAGDSWEDHDRLTGLRLSRHDFEATCVHGSGSVRDLAVCEWNRIDGHPELDGHTLEERQYIFTRVHHVAQNNLPKQLNEHAQALLQASEGVQGWQTYRTGDSAHEAPLDESRYRNRFLAVRRDTPIVPAWNQAADFPSTPLLTAIVVGPQGEEVWCDDLGRVKVQFQGLEPRDHVHAQGAGTNGNDGDSVYLRVDFGWAGADFGVIHPLRVGMEVDVSFLAGDPSKPVITGARYNGANRPPRFSHTGQLPGNRYLSGIKSKEVHGVRYNQLRLDDTPGQISSQLASEHAASQLNLGFMTHPRVNGDGGARGEGGELRTDAQLAVRGAGGVLISSAARPNASGGHLERDEMIGLTRTLQGLVEQLSALADSHQAGDTDSTKFRQLVSQLEDWEKGSNTIPNELSGATPIVAVSAVGGAGIVSQDNLVLAAQTHIDIASAGNTQLSVGQRLLMRCGDLFSAFTQGAMKLIAKDRMDLQADTINLTARSITITASERILLQSPNIRYVAAGAQVDIGDGQIVQQSSGGHAIKSASFAQSSAGNGNPNGANLSSGDLKFDQHIILTDMSTDLPLPNQKIRIRVEDGQIIEATTDAAGRVPVFKSSIAFARYSVELLD